MRLRSWIILVAAVAGPAVTVSCTRDTSPLSPPVRATPEGSGSDALLRTLLGSPVSVVPLQRTAALVANEQASATIGLLGGTLVLPEAGLTVVVPPLAVLAPTSISVTALAGTNVAYELEPHGLTFLAPLIARQDLRETEARRGGPVDPHALIVGYFPNGLVLTSVTELLGTTLSLFGQTSTTLIWHFSGYVWSSGRSEEAPSDGEGR